MIYVRLAGGLGNQLFQIAAAMLADPGEVRAVVPLTGALSQYSTGRQPDSLRLLGPALQVRAPSSRSARLWQWLAVACRAGKWLPGIRLNDAIFRRGISSIGYRRLAIVDGYFQRGWTHANMASATRRMQAQPVMPEAVSRVERTECVMHVRGGDFLQLPAYQVAGLSFYTAAISAARDAGYLHFAVVTDDPGYAARLCASLEDRLSGISIRVIVPAGDPLVDFDTLRCASARIIGNSTFAWWAAALDPKHAKTWSPTHFTCHEERDYYLPWELAIPTQLQAPTSEPSARDEFATGRGTNNGVTSR